MDKTVEETAAAGLAALTHHGVKGMKWGKRKSSEITVVEKGKKLKSAGGHDAPAHPDAVGAERARRIAKSSGVKALSNKELQELSTRMNLEQQVNRLGKTQPKNSAQKFVQKVLGDTAKEQINTIAKTYAAAQVAKMLAKTAVKAAT